ncbi:N(G),N(G)-dimethylarginine dimethylaminohydrolase [Acidaminobacter sp. JC074]|uniref:dimethylarginine dimethylaminohydrolase family protein n=1 Tax=Acidaminobacter sp. JC074 TaxID=2530199 RepID=UPI001F0CFA38|nr:arginine deiminase family protein [Acidaminobacter sp. JC074]MCH4886413.1 N(G),N(G)-dimethylarginine dimethylaminohydrolase [Acidaminobacter sp. JC074]
MFKNVIVRRPGSTVVEGQTTSDLGLPNFELAQKQHDEYIEVLKSTGVAVTVLEANDKYPDSCFVEDPAVVTKDFAIVTNPGVDTRNGEKEIIVEGLKNFYDKYEYITEGTLEGGDVMQIDKHFYIGLSKRTNEAGAKQFISIVEKYGYTGEIVVLKEMFHLKTGVNFIGDNTLLVAGEFITDPRFDSYKKLEIASDEMYAANCIRMNDFLVMPADFPKTKKQLEDAGFKIKEVHMSEFQKIDGGLSCLSLRF